MREVIDLFREKGTVDELGIGQIRDAFSDILFPGTSTLQTRARYHLLVPRAFQRLEREKVSSADAPAKARALELLLIRSLMRSGDHDGVIGRDAGENLLRLPSLLYWTGLAAYGIRRFSGSIADYFRSLDSYHRRIRSMAVSESEEVYDRLRPNWHTGLPEAPDDLFEEAAITLTPPEADYLRDRIVSCHHETLLGALALVPRIPDPQFVWDHGISIPEHLTEVTDHARAFSEVMHGAALLYNLMLARRAAAQQIPRGDRPGVEDFTDRLDSWADMLEARGGGISTWDVATTLDIALSENPNITHASREFARRWAGHALHDPRGVTNSSEAASLIEQRELQTKGGLARLRNRRALEMWNGEAGTTPLDFRWRIAKRILTDIHQSLTDA